MAALHEQPASVQSVVTSGLNLSGTVAYIVGDLSFTQGTHDQVTPNPHPDVLHGDTTWYSSDRRYQIDRDHVPARRP